MSKCHECKNFLGYRGTDFKMGCLREHGSKFDILNTEKVIYYDKGKEPEICPFFEKANSVNSTFYSAMNEMVDSTRNYINKKDGEFKRNL